MTDLKKSLDLKEWIRPQGKSAENLLPRLLTAMRRHFGMEVAFISHFVEGRRRFEYVDADHPEPGIEPGASDPLEDSYCQAIVDGRLPELIPDAQESAAALEFPATRTFPIGAHLSVPLLLANGQVYGTFCCFSRLPNHSLNPRDVEVLHTLADIASEVVQAQAETEERLRVIRRRIESVQEESLLSIVFQPIFDVERGQIFGFESLSRFACEPYRTPDVWFHEAREVGLHTQLELHAVELALESLDHLPSAAYLTLNVSPKVLLESDLTALLRTHPLNRLILEITENDQIDDYDSVDALLRPLRSDGLQLAVDDAGSGYASLRHILLLKPNIIKLDVSITHDIDVDPLRRSLASGLVEFSHASGMKLIAEGVDRTAELDTLRDIGADLSQGFLLSRPLTSDQMQASHLWN